MDQAQLQVGDFDRETFDASMPFFARIGGGSIGGKARGLAFVRRLVGLHGVHRRFPGVEVGVPSAVVIGTDVFDRFLADNGLLDVAINGTDDEVLLRRFLAARLPDDVVTDLDTFVRKVRWPLAVRSSSLLEDSQYQPFTGVYDTFMLPNRHPDHDERLARLRRGGEARVRLDLPAERQGLPAGDAVPAGRGEDGGDRPEGGGRRARAAILSGFLGRGAVVQLLSAITAAARGRRGRGGAWPWAARSWKAGAC